MRRQARCHTYYMLFVCELFMCVWASEWASVFYGFEASEDWSIDYSLVCDFCNTILYTQMRYVCTTIEYWVLSKHDENKTPVCLMHMCCSNLQQINCFRHAFLFVAVVDAGFSWLGHLRQHKHEYKWFGRNEREMRKKEETDGELRRKNSHNETDPDIYVHFGRSLWPHHCILAPTNNFQLW